MRRGKFDGMAWHPIPDFHQLLPVVLYLPHPEHVSFAVGKAMPAAGGVQGRMGDSNHISSLHDLFPWLEKAVPKPNAHLSAHLSIDKHPSTWQSSSDFAF